MRDAVHAGRSLLDESLLRVGDAMRQYHRHHVRGFSHLATALGAGRPVLLIGNHSMDVSDPLLFSTSVYRETGRRLRFIGHEMLFFRLPGLRTLSTLLGAIPSRDLGLARRTLHHDRLLMLYPGAGGEAALRSYRHEPYRLKWHGRLGFVELALREHATLLFVAAVGTDEMYYQTDVALPRRLFDLVGGTYLHEYRGMRLQIGAAGLHILPGIFPLPVRLTHVVSPPLSFEPDVDPENHRAVEETQIRLWAQCQEHLDRAVENRERDSDLLDRALRHAMQLLREVGL
jgi:hypothetical protein